MSAIIKAASTYSQTSDDVASPGVEDLTYKMSMDLKNSLVLEQRPRLKEACIRLQDMAEKLGPDAKLPTMLELRDQFGMSVKTLNSAVRELERRQILYSINGVGIYVASTKRRPQTGNIGFMTNNIRHIENLTYWGLMLAGMRAEAEKRDRHMLFIDNVERFHQWEKIDGVLLTDVGEKYYHCPKLPRPPKNFPGLALLYPLPDLIGVTADDCQSLYNLTEYLIGLGHRRIAYVAAFDQGIDLIQQRFRGYSAALRDAGIELEAGWVRELYIGDVHLTGASFKEIAEHHIRCWLADGWEEAGCTAIIAQNDETAVGMITALQAAGLRVPQDVTVVGFDGVVPASAELELTTVEVPLFDMGQAAVRVLCEWIDSPAQTPEDLALPGRLIIGNTSAPPPKRAASKSSAKAR